MSDLGRGSNNHGSQEIFRRLSDADFDARTVDLLHSREPITAAVHRFFSQMESVALPVPEHADIESEKVAALGALVLSSGFYAMCHMDSGIEAECSRKFEIPVCDLEPMPSIKRAVEVRTTVKLHGNDVESGRACLDDELWEAIMIAGNNHGRENSSRVPWKSRRSTLLGIGGIKIDWMRRYTYEGVVTGACLRRHIGQRLLAMPQLDVSATTYLHSWYGLLATSPVLQITTNESHRFNDTEVSPPEMLPAQFRVLMELLQHS